jgi:hypothetical protein
MDGACNNNENPEKWMHHSGRKPKEKSLFWRPIRAWEHNAKTDLKTVRFEDVDWSHQTLDQVHWQYHLSKVMNLPVPWAGEGRILG